MMILMGLVGAAVLAGGFILYEKSVVDVAEKCEIHDYYTNLSKMMYEARNNKKYKDR